MHILDSNYLKNKNLYFKILILFFIFIIFYFLYCNSYALFNGLDGTWIRLLINSQLNLPISTSLNLDPLRGPGNFSATLNSSLNLSYHIQKIIYGEINPFFSSLFFSFELFLSSLICSKIFNFNLRIGFISGFISIILLFPVFWPHKFYPIFSLLPHLSESFLLINICLYILFINKNILFKIVIFFIIFNFILFLFITSNPLFSIIFLPYLSFTTIFIYANSNKQTKFHLLIYIFGSFIFNFINGAIFFLIGIATYSTPFFFKSELYKSQMSLYNISILFHNDFGSLVFISVSLFLFISFFYKESVYRKLQFYIISVLSFIIILGYILATSKTYSGPSMLYFEIPFYVFFILCFTKIVFDFFSLVFVRTSINYINISSIILFVSITFYTLIIYKPPAVMNTNLSFNLSSNYLIDEVRDNISITSNNIFRGRLATFTGTYDQYNVSWLNLHSFDYYLFNNSKNDFRFIGPWFEGIPTLQEYNQTITPSSYFIFSRTLSRPQDRQLRNIIIFSNPNFKILALYGVKYFFSDKLLGELKPINSIRYNNVYIYLYELSNPNLGTYSPINYEVINDVNMLIKKLSNKNIDLSKIVYLHERPKYPFTIAHDTILSFTPSNDIKVVSKNLGGYSIIVMPFEYSSCYEIHNKNDNFVSIQPVNFNQLAVVYKDFLDIELQFKTGPFVNPLCRIVDTAAFDLLEPNKMISNFPISKNYFSNIFLDNYFIKTSP
jgi:hypothetical protein